MSDEKRIFEPEEGFADAPGGGSFVPETKQSPFAEESPASKSAAAASATLRAAASPFSIDKGAGDARSFAEKVPVSAKTDQDARWRPIETTKPAAATPPPLRDEKAESQPIRQLVLRAIFGVDRELSETEIMQRSRALPGIRHLVRVPESGIGAITGIQRLLGSLGFEGGKVTLHCGGAPLEFVQEGRIVLAVQTEGKFAPGVKETLILVARELDQI